MVPRWLRASRPRRARSWARTCGSPSSIRRSCRSCAALADIASRSRMRCTTTSSTTIGTATSARRPSQAKQSSRKTRPTSSGEVSGNPASAGKASPTRPNPTSATSAALTPHHKPCTLCDSDHEKSDRRSRPGPEARPLREPGWARPAAAVCSTSESSEANHSKPTSAPTDNSSGCASSASATRAAAGSAAADSPARAASAKPDHPLVPHVCNQPSSASRPHRAARSAVRTTKPARRARASTRAELA